MPLRANLRELERKPVHLHGELPTADLDIEGADELVHPAPMVKHDIEVQLMDEGVLAQGHVSLLLHCECARCLKPFDFLLDLPHWAAHLPLEGEEMVAVVDDSVDLTPLIREDILLQFPQHPLCEPECRGLSGPPAGSQTGTNATGRSDAASPWAELDKLKLKN